MTDQIWKVLPGKNVDIYYLELEAQIVSKVQKSISNSHWFVKGSDRQGMVVELRLQYFFEDSFETYLKCIFV